MNLLLLLLIKNKNQLLTTRHNPLNVKEMSIVMCNIQYDYKKFHLKDK
jgi:hypothetical protein